MRQCEPVKDRQGQQIVPKIKEGTNGDNHQASTEKGGWCGCILNSQWMSPQELAHRKNDNC